jgi:hypothetical protein
MERLNFMLKKKEQKQKQYQNTKLSRMQEKKSNEQTSSNETNRQQW